MSIVQTKLRAWLILTLLPGLTWAPVFGQQLAFTSRTYFQSPVVILSIESSKEFGFDSVSLRNDGRDAIGAVHFQIAFRTAAGDEIADQRRVAVSLEPRDTRRLTIGMAHTEGLRQLAKSRNQASALAIISIESVEFQHGGEWHQTERDRGIPLDPLQTPQELNPQRH